MRTSERRKGEKGFTMVEMLAVIAIIGIIASIAIPNLSGSRERARDAKRVTDVSQIALAVEQYYNSCREYPATLSIGATSPNCPSGVTLGTFITSIPTGPLGETYGYVTNGTSFVVRAELEQTNSALSNNLNTAPAGLSIDCSDSSLYFCKGG